jgi:hypothetical protein
MTIEITSLFDCLYDDIKPEDQFAQRQPLLAHYTSLDVLENIVRTNELWFSNPVLMNDAEEVKSGVFNGINAVKQCDEIKKALLTSARIQLFETALNDCFKQFEQEHVFDTYVSAPPNMTR